MIAFYSLMAATLAILAATIERNCDKPPAKV